MLAKPMSAEDRIARLSAFAQALTEKRREAVDGRAASGIEQIWAEDEEFYEGIDDLNREEVKGDLRKSPVLHGTPTATPRQPSNRSNVFVNITQPYVDMASARVSDMLLPNDDKPFSIEPTPMPDIVAATNDPTMIQTAAGQKPAGEIAQMMVDEAMESAKKAESRVWDWLVEAQWHAEMRQIIEDAAKVGSGILKGPFPVKKKSKAIVRGPDGTMKLTIVEKTQPDSKRIDYWNFYPDPACGQNIQNGSYTWEKDRITARQLSELKGSLSYIDSQIDLVLEEGPQRKYQEGADRSDKDLFEIWYFHGFADHDDLMAAGCECDPGKTLPVIVTMVNDRVIKAALSTLDSGEFPYDVMVWQRKANTWTGKGVARQVRTPQRMVNSATRNMLDNAGLSAGPQIVVRYGAVRPGDGVWEMTPRKLWFLDEGADIDDARKAIQSIVIPSMQVELMNIVNYGMELAEKVTSMPLMMQGQQGAATETVGGMTLLQNNASAVLRRIAKIFDDDITIPKIHRYYEWILLYGDDPKEKGDFVIQAKGSTALYERDAQNQAILQMGAFVKDPAFKISPDKWFAEMSRAQKVDPKRIQYSDDEWEQIQKQMAEQGPPVDPRIQGQKDVAQIRVQGDMQKAQLVQQSDMAELQFRAEEAQRERDHDRTMKEMEFQMEMMRFAREQQMSLEEIKATLARDAMKLRVQKELSAGKGSGPQVANPPTEPAGRAENGMAYQQ